MKMKIKNLNLIRMKIEIEIINIDDAESKILHLLPCLTILQKIFFLKGLDLKLLYASN